MHTLFIIGSGALQDAWRPVIEALRETGFRDVRTSDGANFAMSRLVYNMRMHWKLKGDDDDGKELLDKYNGVREKIASKLRDAEARGELRVRAEFEQVSMTFALGVGDTISIATTNWDGAVAAKLQAIADRYSRSVTAKAMHGTSQDSRTLFLPTETVGEPYRDGDEDNSLGGLRVGLLQAVEKTDRIVLYGLSLSPLDAELGEMISSGLDKGNVREFCIIDPWYTSVAERVQVLADSSRGKVIPIRCFHPREVAQASDTGPLEWVYDANALAGENRRLKQLNASS